MKKLLTFTILLVALNGCGGLGESLLTAPAGSGYDPYNQSRYYPYDNDPYYRNDNYYRQRSLEQSRRERERLERDRRRLEEERRRLEEERHRRPYRRPAASAPPPPAVERCPAGFHPSERKCTQRERKRGCKDIRLPGGLGCVSR